MTQLIRRRRIFIANQGLGQNGRNITVLFVIAQC